VPGFWSGSSCAAAESEWTTFTDIYVSGVSEALPVIETFGGFDGDLDEHGDFAYTHNIARLGMQKGDWAFSAFYRYDYYFSFDPDTAELVVREKHDVPVEPDRTYRLELDAIHAESVGFSVARAFSWRDDWRMRARINVMRAYDVVDGSIRGTVHADAQGKFSGFLEIDYVYGKDYLFDRPNVDRPTGWGGSLDLFVEVDLTDTIEVSLEAEDLFSRIEWDDAPSTTAVINSATTRIDERGLLDVKPLLSGFEGERDFTQKLPERYKFKVGYAPGPWRWEFEMRHIEWADYYRVNVDYRLGDDLDFNFAYGFTTNALGLGARYRKLEMFVMSDKLDVRDARALELRFVFSMVL